MKKLIFALFLLPLLAFADGINNPTVITITGDGSGTNRGTPTLPLTITKIGGEAVTLAGPLTTAGAFPLTFTTSGTTNVTLPTSGTLLTTTGSGSSLTGIPTSVSNSDGTLTLSPTTGSVVASLALGHANTWTGVQTFKAPVIDDSNGNGMLTFTTTASAVNNVNLTNSATGNAPTLSAVGTDTNIGLILSGKGTGVIQHASPATFGSSAKTFVMNTNLGTASFTCSSGNLIEWSAGTATVGGSSDTGLFRASSGVIGISTGNESTTSLGSLKLLGIIGVTTNSDAAAGSVGEAVTSSIASASAVSLTTATAANITSISLTAGDWDVEGNINFNTDSGMPAGEGGISTTSATIPTDGTEVYFGPGVLTSAGTTSITPSRKRISLASTTTVYLVASGTFGIGNSYAFGSITARRVR